jgi:hypothetical protein
MTIKVINGECSSCESTYSVEYSEELVAQEYPEHCPFCGEQTQELTEEHLDDDEDPDNSEEEWD